MADYNLGTAKGRIRTEYDNSGVDKAKKSFTEVDKSSKKMSKGFENVRNASGGMALAIAGGLTLAITKAINFEKQISAIGAVSGATGQQMDALRAKALQLGADTTFSASEAANAMEELAKAGVGVDDILNGAADAAVNLAAAGGVDLPTAAEIAANALGQFQLKAADLAHVVDLIAGAANASAISVDDFNLSMKQAGAVANLVGVSFDDMATAIALMGRNGIKGSDAGTSLKTMLLNLQPATKKQREEFKRLGIITKDGSNIFFDARGNMKSLADISGILSDKTKKMTAAQKSATLELLFGSDAIRAAAILTKNGADGFKSMADAMGKIKAADVAKTRMDNVAGSVEQLKGSLETAAITIGTALIPAIRKITDFITLLTNKFNTLDPRWQKMIAFAALAATALLALISAIAAVGFAITGVSTAVATLAGGGIVAAVIAAIAAIVAGFVILWKRSEAFRTAIQTIFGVISEHVSKMRTVIQPFINFVRNELIPLLAQGFKTAIDKLRPAFESISTFMREKVAPALAEFRAALTQAMPTIIKIARFIGQGLVASWIVLAKVISFVVPLLMKVAGFIFPLLLKVISFLIRNIPTFVGWIQTLGKILFTIGKIIAIAVIAPFFLAWKAAQFVFNAIVGIVRFFLGVWNAVWSVVGPVVVAAFNLVKAAISTTITIISAIISVFRTIIVAVFGAVVSFLQAVFAPAWELIKTVITSVFNFLAPFIVAIWNAIVSKISDAVNLIKAVISVAWNIIKAVFTNVWNAIVSVTSVIWAKIRAVIDTAVKIIVGIIDTIKVIVEKVKAFFGQLKAAADGGTGTLIAFVKGIPGKIIDALGNVGKLLYDKGKQIIQGLIDGIKDMLSKLKDTISNAMGIVGRFLPGSPAKEGPLSGQGYTKIRGQHLVEDFAAGIDDNSRMVESAIADILRSLAGQLPNPNNAAAVGTAVASGGTSNPGLIRPAPAAAADNSIRIDKIELKGVWDMTDPLATRKIVGKLDDELTQYRKGFKR
jgi:TP901 family phage tail tape measure protein